MVKLKSRRKESQIATLFFMLLLLELANRVKRIGREDKGIERQESRVASCYIGGWTKGDFNSVFFGGVDKAYLCYSHALFYPALLTFSIF